MGDCNVELSAYKHCRMLLGWVRGALVERLSLTAVLRLTYS